MGCTNSKNELNEEQKDGFDQQKLTKREATIDNNNTYIENEIIALNYIKLFGLDEHDLFDIEQSILFAKQTWLKVIINDEIDIIANNNLLTKLLIDSDINIDDDVVILKNISKDDKLKMNKFIDWYIRHLYKDFKPITDVTMIAK